MPYNHSLIDTVHLSHILDMEKDNVCSWLLGAAGWFNHSDWAKYSDLTLTSNCKFRIRESLVPSGVFPPQTPSNHVFTRMYMWIFPYVNNIHTLYILSSFHMRIWWLYYILFYLIPSIKTDVTFLSLQEHPGGEMLNMTSRFLDLKLCLRTDSFRYDVRLVLSHHVRYVS